MSSLLPRSMLRPCSWCARQRYVGASRIWSISTSIVRPLNACATRLAPSTPTGAMTFTGTIKLAASAKYTAEPPSVSSTLPKGPSRVSRATEPATRSSARCSGTATCAAFRGDHMPCVPKLLQKVLGSRVVLDLHPAASELTRGVRVGSCSRDLVQVFSQPQGRVIFRRLTPRVVGLDDVDPVRDLHDPFGAEVRSMAVERMRYISQATHLVNHVHHILRLHVGRKPALDEQTDHLALACLGLFADDRQVGCDLGQPERSLNGVVIGQGDPVAAAFDAALHQFLERALAVMRVARVQMEIDPHRRIQLNGGGFSEHSLAGASKQWDHLGRTAVLA